MINLIPPKGHTTLKHEYFLRVGATYCFLLSGVFIALSILLTPTYVLVSSQLKLLTTEVDEDSDTKAQFMEAERAVEEANQMIVQLRTPAPKETISDLIREVNRVAGPDITFRTFQVERTEGVVKSLVVQGVAPSRSSLATLESSLESSPLFESAEVPISDLARDSNLPFVITITVREG